MYLYAILGNKFIFVLKSGISDRTFFIRPHQIALLPVRSYAIADYIVPRTKLLKIIAANALVLAADSPTI